MTFVYENAPLREVIAEVHWALTDLGVTPSTKIDPYYDLFRDQFLDFAARNGLTQRQEIVPAIVPAAVLPCQPHLRIRTGAERWPLSQIGPGILTANVVPPYGGWSAFSPFIHLVIDGLFECYPIAEKILNICKLHLRYINAFDHGFDYHIHSEFLERMLGIPQPVPQAFVANRTLLPDRSTHLLEYRFINSQPGNSKGIVKILPGRINQARALILELHCEADFEFHGIDDRKAIEIWFDEAHECISKHFDTLATPALKILMGKKKEVSE